MTKNAELNDMDLQEILTEQFLELVSSLEKLVSFYCFSSSSAAQNGSHKHPQGKQPSNKTNYPTITIVVSTQTEGMLIRPSIASMEEVPTHNYCR